MGDDGKLYVPAESVAVFREQLVPRADYIFPNQTEAELLTDCKIASLDDAVRCLDQLHALGPSLVVITSSTFASDDAHLLLLGSWRSAAATNGSTANGSTAEHTERFQLRVPRLDGHFTGTGDLFSALMLVRMWQEVPLRGETAASAAKSPSAARACELALASVQAVLARTVEFARTRPANAVPRTPELQLIQSASDLRQPATILRAELLK